MREIKYVRMDSILIGRKLLYSDSSLQIDLPDAGEKNEWVIVENKSLISSLYIGKLKRGSMNDFPGVATDSIAIQVMDVLISRSGIDKFLKTEQAKLDQLDRENLTIFLHADKETPEEFIINIKAVVRKYNPNLRVCKAFVNWKNKGVFYKEI